MLTIRELRACEVALRITMDETLNHPLKADLDWQSHMDVKLAYERVQLVLSDHEAELAEAVRRAVEDGQ